MYFVSLLQVLIPAKQSAYYSRGQNSVHLGSNKSKSLGTVIEVQVLERAPDILMSDDRRESSVNELLRDVKLEDSKNTSTTSISDGDREPAGEARKKIFPVVQQVADSSVETSVSVNTEHSPCSVYSYFINCCLNTLSFSFFLFQPFPLSLLYHFITLIFYLYHFLSIIFYFLCLPSSLWLSSHSLLKSLTHSSLSYSSPPLSPPALMPYLIHSSPYSSLPSLTPLSHSSLHSLPLLSLLCLLPLLIPTFSLPPSLIPICHSFLHSLLSLTHSFLSLTSPLTPLPLSLLPLLIPTLSSLTTISLLPSRPPLSHFSTYSPPLSLLHSHFLSLCLLCFRSLKILTWRKIYSPKLLVVAQPHVTS